MRISDWSSDVCSSDLDRCGKPKIGVVSLLDDIFIILEWNDTGHRAENLFARYPMVIVNARKNHRLDKQAALRSEEHTSEIQSLMRISYAVLCLKKKIKHRTKTSNQPEVMTAKKDKRAKQQ